MPGTFSLNGQAFSTGASNGVAADLVAVGALCDRIDAIIADLGVAYRAGPSAFYLQGSSVAGTTAGRDAVSAMGNRLSGSIAQLKLMGALVRSGG